MKSIPTLSTLLSVWLGLLALLALTAGSAFVPLGGMNGVVNLAVALGKAALVMTFFMRLRVAGGATRLAGLAAFGFIAILIGITWFEIASRIGH